MGVPILRSERGENSSHLGDAYPNYFEWIQQSSITLCVTRSGARRSPAGRTFRQLLVSAPSPADRPVRGRRRNPKTRNWGEGSKWRRTRYLEYFGVPLEKVGLSLGLLQSCSI